MMTQSNDLRTSSVHPAPIGKRMVQGASIALVLISIFLLSAGDPNPEWGRFWMIKPLIIVPFAGAVGGAFYYLMDGLRHRGNWSKLGANLLSLAVYIIGLWIGTVLGLNGTMWN